MASPENPIRILVLEPFGDGSHAAFYRGWQTESRHRFTVLELPGVHWKWRSRHSSLTLALQANALLEQGEEFDIVFCSDMLNLSEWRGFAPALAHLPTIAYFHENQFTYPLAAGQQRDYHFAYGNILTAIAAHQVWFNSAYHRDEFRHAAIAWLRRLPDFRHIDLFQQSIDRACVCNPGIREPVRACDSGQYARPMSEPFLKIGWVARWEHDKRPDRFEKVIALLVERGLPFQLILLGQQFRQSHPSFESIKRIAGDRVLHADFAANAVEYWNRLGQIDVVVSTADHEFFGIGIVEAIAAGATPLLPRRLAYPEVLQLEQYPERDVFFYGGETPDNKGGDEEHRQLADGLTQWIMQVPKMPLADALQARAREFLWSNLAPQYDSLLEKIVLEA